MMKYLSLMILVFLSFHVQAQRMIHGWVVDHTGEVLIGGTVAVMDTDIKTRTDENGEFSLKITDNKATLLVTYPGFNFRKIAVNTNEDTVRIVMQPGPKPVNEIIVVTKGIKEERPICNLCLALEVGKDTARDAYSVIRKYLNCGLLPHAYEVKIGEMVNHFSYYYKDSAALYPWMPGTLEGHMIDDLRLTMAVTKFGLILRDGGSDFEEVLKLVNGMEGIEVRRFAALVNKAAMIKYN